MSNPVFVEVNGTEVKVYDDYGSGTVDLGVTPPDSDVELLGKVRSYASIIVKTHNGGNYSRSHNAHTVVGCLRFVKEYSKGVTIRGTYYEYNELAPVFA